MKHCYPSKLLILVLLLAGLNWSALAQTTTFSYTGGIVTWTVPSGVTSIGITAVGAQGGASSYFAGGHGATIYGAFTVVPGHILSILVGQQPASATNVGGGGGGTFVWDNASTTLPMIVAGGGGGAGYSGTSAGTDASVTNNGTIGPSGTTGAGTAGNGATAPSASYYAAGGCGWLSNGAVAYISGTSCSLAQGGTKPLAGGTGGTFGGTSGSDGNGGFGGGGGGQGQCGATGGGGGGGYSGGAAGIYTSSFFGGGGGGSYNAGTSATSSTGTATGSGSVTITILCTSPGVISGNAPVCAGSTITLTNSSPGGTWSSSNTSVATINPSSGLVNALTAGTATMLYTVTNPCGGTAALATATVTVNTSPTPISGSSSVCVGAITTLSNTITGGTWTTSDFTKATIDPSTGNLAGVSTLGASSSAFTVTYTLPGGCNVSTAETVKSTPAIYTAGGGGGYCAGTSAGVDIYQTGSTIGISYQLQNGASPVGGPFSGTGSAIDFGIHAYTPGAYTIVATNPTSFCTSTMSGTVAVTTNPVPAAISGPTHVCVGSTISLTDATPGGTWSSSNSAQASVGISTGIVSGFSAGTPTLTYTASSGGCIATMPVVINTAPPSIDGIFNACIATTTALTDPAPGGNWTASDATVATVGVSSGVVTGVAAGTSIVTYTSTSGCFTTVPVIISPNPAAYAVTGGGPYCSGGSGVHVGLSYSSSGVNYQLYNGTGAVGLPVAGSNSGLDFGLEGSSGAYTVVGTNILSGCVGNMSGSVNITIKPLPPTHDITGGGNYCPGSAGYAIGTDGSDVGVKYQLYNGSSPFGPLVSGTGIGLNFGLFTAVGTYTAVAINPVTGCMSNMAHTAIINMVAPATLYNVGGGGNYCIGGGGAPIMLSGSDLTSIYQVYDGTVAKGTALSGDGGPLNFGLFSDAGVYTITATNVSYGCNTNMSGSATIIINPLPTPNNVTGTGGYCTGAAGRHVGLDFGGTGITYVLMQGTTAVDTVIGTGSGLDFGLQPAGIYTVVGLNTSTLCSNNMTGTAVITAYPLPLAYNVSGGGSFCLGGSGSSISLTGSDAGVSYQLYRGTAAVGAPVTGAGGFSFGSFTAPGTYTVVAKDASNLCTNTMSGSAIIAVNPLPASYTVTGGGNFCVGGAGLDVSLSGSDSGISYNLVSSVSGIVSTSLGTGSAIDFGILATAGNYTVVATDLTSSCMKNMPGSATIIIDPLPDMHNVTGGGADCADGPGFPIGLDGSGTGISYQLFNGSGPSGGAVSGSGAALVLGTRTAAGTYNVVATNPLTGCSSNMAGAATIVVNPLPNPYSISGGGNYCLGGPGQDVFLLGGASDPGVSYQLYLGGSSTGSPVVGTGSAVDFGNQTGSGVYSVIATNVSGCSSHMPGSVFINVVTPGIYTIAGGGNYCAGGSGQDVNLSSSGSGVSYQLYVGGAPVGLPVIGTGGPIDFGLQVSAGAYTVVATTVPLGCTANMAGTVSIAVNPLPIPQTVTGGGPYCVGGAGVDIGLAASVSGVQYQLYNGAIASGPFMPGTGGALDFGMKTDSGTYTVVGTDLSSICSGNMANNVLVTVQPSPTPYPVTVSNSGYYCAVDSGVHIGIVNSDAGINYQLFRGATPVGVLVAGTGAALDFGVEGIAGTYTVIGSGASAGCLGDMSGSATVHIVPLPAVHNVTGGGGYCPGGSGVHIGLNGSSLATTYQLYRGVVAETILYGTGLPLDFGIKTDTGIYSVVANSTITTCPNNMFGTPEVSINTLLTPSVTIHSYPGNDVDVWHIDSMKVFVSNAGSNPHYQWIVNGNPIAGATNASFVGYEFFNNDNVGCMVTASGPCGGNTVTESVVLTIHNVGVSQVVNAGASVSLIPNPNKGLFTLKGMLGQAIDEEATIEVTNMLGQVVYTGKAAIQNGNIDAQVQLGNSLANGMYILDLRSVAGNTVFHFVVEN